MAEQSLSMQARRPYHSPMRQRQAEHTRRRILDAARTLFLSVGYAGTTVEAIAAAADVSPKTIAAALGSKRAILAALVSPPAFGRRFQEVRDELVTAPDPRRRVELAARLARQVYDVLAPEFDLLRGATAVAPELAEVARRVGARRRQNQTRLIAYLREHDVLRDGLDPEDAVDVVWALTGYDLYRALVVERGWQPDRYEAWLAEVLSERLLAPR